MWEEVPSVLPELLNEENSGGGEIFRAASQSTHYQFCPQNKALDKRIRDLHTRLMQGQPGVQTQIDRYLYLVYMLRNGLQENDSLKKVPLSFFVTHHTLTPQYGTLPDLTRIIRSGIFTQNWKLSTFHILLQNSIPCLKKSRLFHTVFQSENPGTDVVACVNMLHGTLLGLYPDNTKYPTFNVRTEIVGQLHGIMTSPLRKQQDFLHRNINIVRLSFMEYFVNVCTDFLPAEYEYFSKIRGMQEYFNICKSTCDNFRQETLQLSHFKQTDWPTLNAKALVLIDRCTRTCKLKIYKPDANIQVLLLGNQELDKRVSLKMSSVLRDMKPPDIAVALNTHICYGNISFQVLNNAIRSDSRLCNIIQQVHQNIQCFPLPTNLMKLQIQQLFQLSSHCLHHIDNVSKMYVCLHCTNKPKADPLKKELRMCMQTCEFTCSNCKNGNTVLPINMLGRLLLIKNSFYYLCPFCTRVHQWNGTGMEFTRPHEDCVLDFVSTRRNKKVKVDCVRCQRNSNGQPLVLFDRNQERMITAYLCSRHMPPAYILPYIKDTYQLAQYIVDKRIQNMNRNYY